MAWHHLFNYQVTKAKVLSYHDINKTEDNGAENMDVPLLYKTMKQLATQSLDCVKKMIVFFEDRRWTSLRCSTQNSQGQRKNWPQWRNSIPPKLLMIEGSPCHVAPWVKWDAESWNIVHKLLDSLMLWIRIHLESNQFVPVFNFTMRFLNTLIWTFCNHPIHILSLSTVPYIMLYNSHYTIYAFPSLSPTNLYRTTPRLQPSYLSLIGHFPLR